MNDVIINNMITKKCSQCDVEKDINEFFFANKSKNIRQSYCKICYKKYDAHRHHTNRDKRNEEARIFYQNNKEKWAEKVKKHILLYPEKHKARNKLRYAVYTGKIIKQPCEVCGEVKVEGHHKDYSKPLEVNWLCHKHHMETHRTTNYLGKTNYIKEHE